MENKPIDDLFARKLRSAEIHPDNNTWATLQKKRGAQQAWPLWSYVGIAASLIMVGMFSWWMIQTQEVGVAKVTAGHQRLPDQSQRVSDDKQVMLAGHEFTDHTLLDSINKAQRRVTKHMASHLHTYTTSNISVKSVQPKEAFTQGVGELAINNEKKQLIPTLEPSRPVPSVVKEPLQVINAPSDERTLVVSISTETPDLQPNGVEPLSTGVNPNHKRGFSSFLKKVKRLKEGEAIAVNTDNVSKTDRRGLTKLFDEVRESISNNTTDK